MKKENYICIQGWMRGLGLKGQELLIYAIIYGFCQSEGQRYTGTLQYLAEWCGSTKRSVMTALKSLVTKGLVMRDERIVNGVKFVEYFTTGEKISLGGGEKFSLGSEKISPIDNIDILKSSKSIEKTTKRDAVISYTENEELRAALLDFVSMRKEMKKPMTERAIALMLKRLDGMAKTDEEKIAVVNQSIEHSWQTVYPIKTEDEKKKPAPKKDAENKSFDTDEFFALSLGKKKGGGGSS